MAKTKGGKKSWGSKYWNACTVLFNAYHEDSTDGVSYETVDAESKDYIDSVYCSHEIFQETEKILQKPFQRLCRNFSS